MGGEFNTYLQIAGHFSGDFNTVPEVRSLRWYRYRYVFDVPVISTDV